MIYLMPFLLILSTPLFGETQTITQKGKKFSVDALTVKVGEKVVFANDDDTSHNVFSTNAGNNFNLKIQKPGEKSEHAFATPGEVDVRCAIHPSMRIKVKVTP